MWLVSWLVVVAALVWDPCWLLCMFVYLCVGLAGCHWLLPVVTVAAAALAVAAIIVAALDFCW